MSAPKRAVFLGCSLILSAALPLPARAIMAGEGLMWSVLPSAPVSLRVCWLNPGGADPLGWETVQTSGAQRREWVRLALKKSWEREARVVFTGWETCQNEGSATDPPHTLGPRRPGTADENIKIEITSTDGGQNPAHGSWGDYQSPSVILNLHLPASTSRQLHDKLDYLVIHEFGHALGFYHEEERGDWPSPPGCPKQDWGPDPIDPWWPIPTELRWGAADRTSVMAYCSGWPTDLSPKDTAGAQRAYGRHLPGTLLSTRGSLCLSAHAADPNGDPVFGWECDEALDDQEWLYDTVGRSLSIGDPRGGERRCLDVDTEAPSSVQTWDCNGWPNQRWLFRRVLLRGYGGLCLTRGRAGTVRMRPCTGGAAQRWRVVPRRSGAVRIQAEGTATCLKAAGDVGTRVRTAACGRTGGQGFLLLPGGRLQPATQAGICLDVRDVWDADYTSGLGGPRPGQVVQLFTCEDQQLNQRWSLTGHVVSGKRCLSRAGNGTGNGTAAVMRRCGTSAEQDWDYLW